MLNISIIVKIMEMLGIKSNLEIMETLEYQNMRPGFLNSFFVRYRAMNTWNGVS